MRYLLVGNGPSNTIAEKARLADIVIQINTCQHAELIPPEKTTYVVIVNTAEVFDAIHNALEQKRPLLLHATVLLARNKFFYLLKRTMLSILRSWHTKFYLLANDRELNWQRKEAVSFLSTLRLELKLLGLGMKATLMPSTGMVAYHWLSEKLKPEDSLDITGFTFEGWASHPWKIEKTIIKTVHPPGVASEPVQKETKDLLVS